MDVCARIVVSSIVAHPPSKKKEEKEEVEEEEGEWKNTCYIIQVHSKNIITVV